MKTTAILNLSFLSFAGSLSFLLASPEPIDLAHYSAPVRVACVGDSITQGSGAEPGKSYPSQLQAILGGKWQVKNFGVGGRTLLKKGDFPYWKEHAFKDAHDFQPDVVIIMLGTNDTKPQNWVHHDEFYADYKDLVESFKSLPSNPRVFICRPVPVSGQGNYGINETNLAIEIPLIDRIAAEEKVDLIDMHAALLPHPELFPDRVHPNTAGAGIMAQTAAAALTGKSGTP
jgi:acyl-CoA thioesterase I